MMRHALVKALLVGGVVVAAGAGGVPAVAADGPRSTVTPPARLAPYVEPSTVLVESSWSAAIRDDLSQEEPYLDDGATFTVTRACTGFVVAPDGFVATAGRCLVSTDTGLDIDRRRDLIEAGVTWALRKGRYGDLDRAGLTAYALSNWDLVSPTSTSGQTITTPAHSVTVSGGTVVDGTRAGLGTLPARVIEAAEFADGGVGLLRIKADDLNALPLAAEAPEKGAQVFAVGLSAGAEAGDPPVVRAGTVSGRALVGGGATPSLELDAGVSPSMSGGPTVNAAGEIVGVNSFGSRRFVQPARLVQRALDAHGVQGGPSEISELYATGLDAYFAGRRQLAVRSLQAVVVAQPGNTLARDYVARAQALPAPPWAPATRGTSWLPLVLVAAALVLLLGGATVALVRRRRDWHEDPGPAQIDPVSGPLSGSFSGSLSDSLTGSLPDSGLPRQRAAQTHGGVPARPMAGSSPGDRVAATDSDGRRTSSPRTATSGQPGSSGASRTAPSVTQAVPSQPPGPSAPAATCRSCGAPLAADEATCRECGHRA